MSVTDCYVSNGLGARERHVIDGLVGLSLSSRSPWQPRDELGTRKRIYFSSGKNPCTYKYALKL